MRLWHWINAAVFLALVVSGAMILWVLPELYWREDGYYGYGHPSLISFLLEPNQKYSAPGRNAHFLAAWIFVLNGAFYLFYGIVSGHFMRRLLHSPCKLRPAKSLGQASPTQAPHPRNRGATLAARSLARATIGANHPLLCCLRACVVPLHTLGPVVPTGFGRLLWAMITSGLNLAQREDNP